MLLKNNNSNGECISKIYDEYATAFNNLADILEEKSIDINDLVLVLQKHERVIKYVNIF